MLTSIQAKQAFAWCTPRILTCGSVIDSNTITGHDDVSSFNCAPGRSFNGKAHVYKIHHPGDSLWIRLEWTGDQAHELGVFVLSSCDQNRCIAYNAHEINLKPGHGDYWIVVDSRTDVGTIYRLRVLCGDYRLPVELTSFSATNSAEGVQLSWTTASETNNRGFRVERQNENSETWDPVAFVTGQGTVTTTTPYTYTDAHVTDGSTYAYHLLSETNNGELEEVSLITVTYAAPAVPLASEYRLIGNYPNPFNPNTRVVFEVAQNDQISLDVFDISGRLVQTIASGQYDAGIHSVEFSAAGLPSGVYFARLSGTFGSQMMKMMLLK
jgi:hypothetical protein